MYAIREAPGVWPQHEERAETTDTLAVTRNYIKKRLKVI